MMKRRRRIKRRRRKGRESGWDCDSVVESACLVRHWVGSGHHIQNKIKVKKGEGGRGGGY